MHRFENKVALVTGAGSGIGRATALHLAREGAAIALSGRHVEPLEETERMARGGSGAVLVAPMDVRDPQDVARTFDQTERGLGPVDVVIASHGVNVLSPVDRSSLDDWQDVIATNLTGTFLVVREAVRRMAPRRTGRIVVVSSVSGRPGFRKYPGFAAYASSKYALTGLVEVLAAELARSGVGLAMICPSGVDTEMFRRTFPGSAAELAPERVASAIADLADPDAPPPAGTIVDLT